MKDHVKRAQPENGQPHRIEKKNPQLKWIIDVEIGILFKLVAE